MTVLDGTFIGIHKDVGFVSMRVTAGGSGRNHIMTLSTQGSESDGSSSSHVFLLLAQAGVGGGGGGVMAAAATTNSHADRHCGGVRQ